ncbi:transglycosylase domain-containing protein [Phosphitispora sp. TUW77]|uniref:transglycosylase domain-containing protein n=1 Tax=Phosphitispora sp. TUW77 TaxID=3152361 RepID=UPI003AB5EB24
MSNQQRPRRNKTKKKLNIFKLSFVIIVFLMLACAGSAAGYIIYSIKEMPAWDPSALNFNLPTIIYDKDNNEIARIYVENRELVTLQEVPQSVKNAILATEDIRFYEHKGIDIVRIGGALIADIKAGRAEQGASTITQQLIKRAFLSPEKKLVRKIQEAFLAIQLERKYTKDQIFEMYLNQIYYGGGAYGIQSAAQAFFEKPVKDLTLEEAALLAALPRAPGYYDPYKNPEAALKRRNLVLNNMVRYDLISAAEAETAKATEIKLGDSKPAQTKNYKFPYFVDYVTDLIIEEYGEDMVYKEGLAVYTTLDPKIQTLAEEAMADPNNFPKVQYDKNGVAQPQAAAVVLDPNTGHIKAIVGGRDHKQKRQFNRATDALRQPGSTFKPIVDYGPAIENGDAPATVVEDAPLTIGSKTFNNYNGQYAGIVTYRTAVLKSMNIPAVKVLKETGINKGIKFAQKLGITTLVTSADNSSHNDENLSLALGGITYGVKPLELAGAYGAFANEGVFVTPTAITRVIDRDGNIIDEFKPKKTVAMKKTTAYLITSMLQSVVADPGGTGSSARLGNRPVAGKTGTTSDDKDAWFAGYTPELVTVVWMGHDEPKGMSGVYGGKYPARIWKHIMSNALKDAPVKDFPKPAGIVSATICSQSGLLPGENCPEEYRVTDLFVKGTVPTETCDNHSLVEVCAESHQLPTPWCPDIIIHSFAKGQEPDTTCTIHERTAPYPNGTPICIDPRHGGIMYRAIIPGPNEMGGCPPDMIQYLDFPLGQSPDIYCPIHDHQLVTDPTKEPSQPRFTE